jgi:type IV pilus assembly protein PilA
MRKQKGFSLIELLIVVAIILIIAAIAIPNFMKARMSANEASAVQTTRAIFTAEAAYYASGWQNPNSIGYSAQLSDLGDSGGCNPPSATSACQIDSTVANATSPQTGKSGYYFTYVPHNAGAGSNTAFDLNADPIVRGGTGQRSFFTDQSGVIHFNIAQKATLSDPILQ